VGWGGGLVRSAVRHGDAEGEKTFGAASALAVEGVRPGQGSRSSGLRGHARRAPAMRADAGYPDAGRFDSSVQQRDSGDGRHGGRVQVQREPAWGQISRPRLILRRLKRSIDTGFCSSESGQGTRSFWRHRTSSGLSPWFVANRRRGERASGRANRLPAGPFLYVPHSTLNRPLAALSRGLIRFRHSSPGFRLSDSEQVAESSSPIWTELD
jgi:hypothetical protein